MSRHKKYFKKVENLLGRKLKTREYPLLGKYIKMHSDEVLDQALEITSKASSTNLVKYFIGICSSLENKDKSDNLFNQLNKNLK